MTMNFQIHFQREAIPIDAFPISFDRFFDARPWRSFQAAARWFSFLPTRNNGPSGCWPCLRTDELLVAGCDAPEAYPALTTRVNPFTCSSGKSPSNTASGPRATPG
jgi:hypothetical protein